MKTPRIELNLPADIYRAADGISKSDLSVFAECPAKYRAVRLGLIKREPSPAMQFGTLLHAAVLGGEVEYAVKPDGMSFASKDGKAWREEQSGKMIVSQAEADEIRRTSSAILAHRHTDKLFNDGQAEVSMFGSDKATGVLIKGRADWLAKNYIADIKTIRSADNRECSRAIFKYKYHWQAFYYRELARQNGYDIANFYFVFVERGQFPLINVRTISPAAMELAAIEVGKLLADLKKCCDAGIWHDYSGDGDEPGEIDLPQYAYTDLTGAEYFSVPTETMQPNELDLIP